MFRAMMPVAASCFQGHSWTWQVEQLGAGHMTGNGFGKSMLRLLPQAGCLVLHFGVPTDGVR
jgi:hypothetical protein